MSSRPSRNFAGIMRFVRFITSCVGADAYDPNFRINSITALTVSTIVIYTIFTISTVIKEFKENWMFMLEACVMGGSVVQGVNKLGIGVFSARKVYELNQLITNIYAEYESKLDPRYIQVLLHNCHKLRRALLFVGISYLLGASGIILTPLVASHLKDKLYLIMHFHIPGVDVQTRLGAWLTQGTHALCITVGGLGMYAGDMVIVVHLLQSFVFADVLRIKVDTLNNYIQIQILTDESECLTTQMIVDLAQWHQTYLTFISQCNELFYVMVSVQIATSAVCIVMTIFALLTSDWPGGYPYILVIVPNMYLYCILGTLLENCNDDVMFEIYNISFYDLSVRQQRLILFMLAKSQRPDTILLLGVMPLAVSTALKITKSIYSMTMMMINFIMK